MVTRRSLITGGVFAAAGGAATGSTAPAGTPSPALQSSRGDEQATRVLEQILAELRLQRGACSPAGCQVADAIRSQQRTFLKSRGKFPDFIDVGIDVWESIYDWHVMAGQKPEISRMQDGRYGMGFMTTTLVLRHDMPGSHLGLGYDSRGE